MLEHDKQMLSDHYLDFYQTAYALLQNESDVEDAVQEALVQTMSRVWVNNPYNYCQRVLKNYCYKMLTRKYVVLTNDLPEYEPGESVDEARVQQIALLWQQLPKRIRDIFDLYYNKGYTQSQIVAETGMSRAMVKKLFHKGHARLRQQMTEYDKNNKDIFKSHE